MVGAHMLALGLQGLGSQSFPASMTGCGATWFWKKGVPADVPCPLECLGHLSGLPLPSQIPLCVMSPVCLSPNGLSHNQRCYHGEDTPNLEDLTLRETQLAPRSSSGGQHQHGDIPHSTLPHTNSVLSFGHQGQVTPALQIQECPWPPLGAAPGVRALQEHGRGGDTLPLLLSPGGDILGW